MPVLAAAGYHVIAPDQRGYGRTTGWDPDYDGDLASFRLPNLVRDALGLVSAFGYRSVDAVIGHDFGSSVAAWCALIRPDVFRSVVMMSAPFGGPPSLPFNTARRTRQAAPMIPFIAISRRCRGRENITNGTTRRARRTPTCTARRRACMISCAPTTITRARTGKTTSPIRCKSWTAGEIAKLPTYYVMDLAKDMAATVAEEMPSAAEIAANKWLPDSELAFYSAEYERTGFQGGLQWYRCGTSGAFTPELQTWSGRTIDVPSCLHLGQAGLGHLSAPRRLSRRCRRRPAPT